MGRDLKAEERVNSSKSAKSAKSGGIVNFPTQKLA